MARQIISGAPGTAWVNDTGRVRYQFFCDWTKTCGVCAQYDTLIGPIWPIPLHRHCRCRQVAVPPGAKAAPFVDFEAKAKTLGPEGRRALVGASAFRLWEAGVVEWKDVVTPWRVRTLAEVVAIKKLTVDAMTKAGVSPRAAAEAWRSVNTPEHQLVAAQRARIVESLKTAGIGAGTTAGLVAEGLTARAVVGASSVGRDVPPREESFLSKLLNFLADWSRARRPPAPRLRPKPGEREDES